MSFRRLSLQQSREYMILICSFVRFLLVIAFPRATVDYLIMHDIIMHICHIASILDGNMGGGEMGYIMHNA